MMKKLFGTMVVTVAMFTGYSAYDAQGERILSDSVLANVEALANNESMTNEEYQEKYGCTAVTYEAICTDKYGDIHRYAIDYVE